MYHVHYYARGKLSKKNRLKFIQLNSLQQDSLESAMQNTMNVERDHINITKRLDELTTHDLVMNIFPNYTSWYLWSYGSVSVSSIFLKSFLYIVVEGGF